MVKVSVRLSVSRVSPHCVRLHSGSQARRIFLSAIVVGDFSLAAPSFLLHSSYVCRLLHVFFLQQATDILLFNPPSDESPSDESPPAP